MSIKKTHIVWIVITLAVILFAVFVYINREKTGRVITPFIMAGGVSYIVSPFVSLMEKRKIKKSISILLVYIVFILLSAILTVFFAPQLSKSATELLGKLPELASAYQDMINNTLTSIKTGNWSPDIKQFLFEEIENAAGMAEDFFEELLTKLINSIMLTVSLFIDLLIAFVVAYYIMKDSEHFKSVFLSIFPIKRRSGINSLGREINRILKNFIRGQLLASFLVGVMEIIGLYIAGIKYPLLLGVIGGGANIIPYFGPVIGAVPAVAVALAQSPIKAVWALVIFIIAQQVENSLIIPRIMEEKLGMHPVTTIFVVLFGGRFFGIAGMLFAVPVAAILKVLVKSSIDAIA
jgi:predicted PurR-regulated permease PerM